MREYGQQTSVIPAIYLWRVIFEQFRIYWGTTEVAGEISKVMHYAWKMWGEV